MGGDLKTSPLKRIFFSAPTYTLELDNALPSDKKPHPHFHLLFLTYFNSCPNTKEICRRGRIFLLLCDCWLLLSSMSPDAIVEGDRTVISLGEWSQCQQSPSIPSLISIPQCTLGVSLSQLVSQLKQKTGNFFLINHLDHSGQTKSFISFSCLPSTLASESPAEHSRFQGRFSRQNEFLKSYFYSYL